MLERAVSGMANEQVKVRVEVTKMERRECIERKRVRRKEVRVEDRPKKRLNGKKQIYII